MPHEWKCTAERDAKEDWEGTQVTLSHWHAQKLQTNIFSYCLGAVFFCRSTFFHYNSQISISSLLLSAISGFPLPLCLRHGLSLS